MSTVNKGDLFENSVYRYLHAELKNDRLFIQGKTSQIFRKKAYFSRDRQSNIVIDMSIETFIPGSSDYSLLTVIECKDYSHAIPVDDIEELNSKVQQISGNNVKVIFATTSAMQKAALEYARSRKIAVIRFLPEDQVRWVLFNHTGDIESRQLNLSFGEFHPAFLNQKYVGLNTDFYALNEGILYNSLHSLLRFLLV
jgi:hypothetical protein